MFLILYLHISIFFSLQAIITIIMKKVFQIHIILETLKGQIKKVIKTKNYQETKKVN